MDSIGSKSMGFGHRIGYCRPGCDVHSASWEPRPVSIGGTPLQTLMGAMPQLDESKFKEGMARKSLQMMAQISCRATDCK